MSSTTWTDEKRRFFLETLLDLKLQGKMTDSGNFKKEAWSEALKIFNDKFKAKWELQTLKTEHTNVKSKFQSYQTLMDMSGQPFDYDEETKMVTGDDEHWDDVIATCMKSKETVLKQLRKKPYLNVQLLEDLLTNQFARGKDAISLAGLGLKIPPTKRRKMKQIEDTDSEEEPDVAKSNQSSLCLDETPIKATIKATAIITPSLSNSTRKNGAMIIGESIKEMGVTFAKAISQPEPSSMR
jgi:hypothetical protein